MLPKQRSVGLKASLLSPTSAAAKGQLRGSAEVGRVVSPTKEGGGGECATHGRRVCSAELLRDVLAAPSLS